MGVVAAAELPSLKQPLASIEWAHLGEGGKPAGTLENVQAVGKAYGVVVARPPHCNTDDFTFWFGVERYEACAEHQRDCQRERMREVCTLNGMDIRHDTIARYADLLGMEQERRERKCGNEKRLKQVGAL